MMIQLEQLVRTLALLSCMMFAYGCSAVGPDYVQPETTVPPNWNSAMTRGLQQKAVQDDVLSCWWEVLKDPVLSGLMKQAINSNLNLKQGAARVRKARALSGAAGAGQYPVVDVAGSYTHSGTQDSSGGDTSRNLYTAGLDASWELDLFGSVSRAMEAADADLQAEQEAFQSVRVSLLAELALNYVEMRTFQARLVTAKNNLAIQQETYDLSQYRHLAGLGDELAVQQALYNLETTRSTLPAFNAGMDKAQNRISILLGKAPGSIHNILNKDAAIPVPPKSVAVGIPADTLRRRPDLRQAERQLAAQTARIGEAKADLYPQISLLGSLGLAADTMGSLCHFDNQIFSIGPRFVWHIFDAGAVRSNIEVQSALQEEALHRYESIVLTALEEVENALTSFMNEQDRRDSLFIAATTAREAEQLVRIQYQAGLIDFSQVLEAQRSLVIFQDSLAQSEGQVTSNLVILYKALGGGWDLSVLIENKESKGRLSARLPATF